MSKQVSTGSGLRVRWGLPPVVIWIQVTNMDGKPWQLDMPTTAVRSEKGLTCLVGVISVAFRVLKLLISWMPGLP